MNRRLALLLGSSALGVGLVAMAAPGLVSFRLDQFLVSVIGVLALVQAVRASRARWNRDRTEAETPSPEQILTAPPPGENLEAVLGQFADTHSLQFSRARIQNGLRSAAVAVLTQYGGYSRPDATAAVAAGTWTNETGAAAFLGDESAPAPDITTRLRAAVRRGSVLQRRYIRHTVDEITAIAGVVLETPEETDTRPRRRRHDSTGVGPSTTDTDGDVELDDETDLARDTHVTGHWRGVSAVALVGIGLGALVKQPAVLLAGVVGIGFAAYARSSALPPGSVSLDRTVSTARPDPGDDVDVSLTVTNDSGRLLPDIRLVDGVPEALAVTDGSPRTGTALRPGESHTFTYTVTARRGVHSFTPTTVVARNLTTRVEQQWSLSAETTLTSVPPLRPLRAQVPLREQASQYVGRVATPSGGDGTEFHATREYRQGDPMSRIDWNRRARTGDLTTVEFRDERAATVLVVVDARKPAYVSPAPHTPHAVDRTVDAARRLFATLSDSGDRVGIAAVSPEQCWLAPGAGGTHRVEARKLLATSPALASVPPEADASRRRCQDRIRKRLSPETQLLVLTPLCDDDSRQFAQEFEEYGYPVTVISPNPTTSLTASHRLSTVARALRISALRDRGIPVVDWSWDESLDTVLARHSERRSR